MDSPVGGLELTVEGEWLLSLEILPVPGPPGVPEHPAAAALQAWFRDPRWVVLPPLAPAPTPFQARVRSALLAIPCGETRTYGALARALGTSPRALGQACRANPVPILVPCHRVVAAGGVGGYAGATGGWHLRVKRRLLALEKSVVRPHRLTPVAKKKGG
ncbi:MAG: methylated-DNA--[protein]-cysteine S-methyltransferase [Gammaproteobacteria bacterium]|nr:MAG: methylated-DNA--[protein]-cysteine S-methyltransferase [Gammaproteobacteria bacterium]